MKKLKILYIANGNSIHDLKWISYFSEQVESGIPMFKWHFGMNRPRAFYE